MRKKTALAAALFACLGAFALYGQARPVTLEVDAREAPRKIFHARLTVPARPGPLTLLYPKWLPGEHGPTGPIADVAGLVFTAGGKTLALAPGSRRHVRLPPRRPRGRPGGRGGL